MFVLLALTHASRCWILEPHGKWRAGREFTVVGGRRDALNSQSLFGTFGTTAKSTNTTQLSAPPDTHTIYTSALLTRLRNTDILRENVG